MSAEQKEWFEIDGVEDEMLIKKVKSETITKKDLLNVELTDIVRGAYHNVYLEGVIEEHLGYRPLMNCSDSQRTYVE